MTNISSEIQHAEYISFTTYRKTGVSVATPVWFAIGEGDIFVFSAPEAGKVKRLKNSSKASISPCNVIGKVSGAEYSCQAFLMKNDDQQIGLAKTAFAKKYSWQWRTINFFSFLAGKINNRTFIKIKID